MSAAAVEARVNEETGVAVYRLGDLETVAACQVCGLPFIPSRRGQKTCGGAACVRTAELRAQRARHGHADRSALPRRMCPKCCAEFAPLFARQVTCGADRCRYALRYDKERADPAEVARNRARNHAWAVAHRGVRRREPWLIGPPPYAAHLPGGGMELHITPPPHWPIEHRNIRALHGLITQLTDVPHQRWPEFSLIPWPRGCGWGVYVRRDDVAERMAGRTFEGVLYDRPVTVRTSPLVRLRAPRVEKRGRQRVRIDAVTPVCIRCTQREGEGGATTREWRTDPTADNMRSALAVEFPARLGLALGDDDLRLEMVEKATQPQTVQLGGKYGVVRGWVGHCVVEVNAVGRWLLGCAAQVGLGGRTAFGFGRVRVSDAC